MLMLKLETRLKKGENRETVFGVFSDLKLDGPIVAQGNENRKQKTPPLMPRVKSVLTFD